MRILQIGATYVGAQEKIEYIIHRYLENRGHESFILYAYGTSNDARVIKYESKCTNIMRRILWKYLDRTPHAALLSTIQLLSKIEKIHPDIVHLHILHHGYIDYILLLKYLSRKKIPVVYTMHDMWAFTGGCYHYTEEVCGGYMQNCTNCPKNTSELDCNSTKTSYYLNKKINLFNNLNKIVFVAVSDWVHQEIMKSKLSCYQQETVWNSFDADAYMNTDGVQDIKLLKEFKARDKFRIIGVAANWDIKKGINRFFELAKLLGDEFEIVLVGNVNETLKNTAPANIIFTGKIMEKCVLAKCYEESDIHISMSFEETFGLTFVEAAFSGIRSIGFNSTAIAQVVSKVKGYVIKENNVSGMASKVMELSQDRKACRLSETEKKEIFSDFSSQKMAKEYFRIYSALIGENENA